jgi:hypothetical protein
MISSLTRLMVMKPIKKRMIVSCNSDSDVSRANSDSHGCGHRSHVGHISHVGVGSGSYVLVESIVWESGLYHDQSLP